MTPEKIEKALIKGLDLGLPYRIGGKQSKEKYNNNQTKKQGVHMK